MPTAAGERVGYLRVVPDLAVEIRSPTDADADVRARVALYLDAGVRLVWLADPRQQAIEEARPSTAGPTEPRLLRAEARDTLDGGDAAPGFRLPVSEVFA